MGSHKAVGSAAVARVRRALPASRAPRTGGGLALALAASLLDLAACHGVIGDRPSRPPDAAGPSGIAPPPASALGPAGLRVLTPVQYANTVHDLLGAQVPVEPIGQWRSSIAASQGGIAPASVEQYEGAATSAASFVFGDATRRATLVGCTPAGTPGDACARDFLARFGRRAWRRPLAADELERYATLASSIAGQLGDPWRGVELAVAGMLQSPHFLYREELGVADPAAPERVRFVGYEMATRVAFLVTNRAPDDALLDAAERGELDTAAGVRAHVQRLTGSPSGRQGLEAFGVDLLDLDSLPSLERDAARFPAFTPSLANAMREQLTRTFGAFADGRDFRDLFTTRETFVNAELASFYGLTGTFDAGFAPVVLPESGPRAGLLTFAGVMALQAGLASTSPTLRGKFVRNRLLCQDIPPPPVGVSAVIPPATAGTSATTRELLSQHAQPQCASCHRFMDPIGFALETFDAVGQYRTTQAGRTIDPSGELDGAAFGDARGLGRALRTHERLASCVLRNLIAYGAGHVVTVDSPEITAATQYFASHGYDLREAFVATAVSDAFRYAIRPEGVSR